MMKRRSLATFATILFVAGCTEEREPYEPIQAVPPGEQRLIVLRPEGNELRATAYRHGPIEPPRRIHFPCRMQPGAPFAIVESIIDVEGRVALAVVIAGARGPHVDERVRSCLESARFTPARMDGRPVPVYFNVTVGIGKD